MTFFKRYFYRLIYHYLSIYVRPTDTIVEIDLRHDQTNLLLDNTVLFNSRKNVDKRAANMRTIASWEELKEFKPDYIVCNGNFHYERDIQAFMQRVHDSCTPATRVIITYYSSLWKPVLKLASLLGIRAKEPEGNWIAPEDIENILSLSDFESVLDTGRIILPVYIPILSSICNRYLAPLPFFRLFCMMHVVVARPIINIDSQPPSVSVVVPARNEAGNIEQIMKRVPKMGPHDELIFVEGHSTDDTWEIIQNVQKKYNDRHRIIITKQDGKGKGDAVRKGFSMASKEILIILDADMTVSPENLPLFYDAIVRNKGEFINGSRLVYPMDENAMKFINMIGNKFFALTFSFVLGQRLKDTLCGTKVLTKKNYDKIAAHRSFFGNFDPFGDFDLIFGAARLGLRIKEIPIHYRERVYGATNIDRWRHGFLLLRMLFFAARKIHFV
jgi:hypothetical protein